jgi:hypothetical protein
LNSRNLDGSCHFYCYCGPARPKFCSGQQSAASSAVDGIRDADDSFVETRYQVSEQIKIVRLIGGVCKLLLVVTSVYWYFTYYIDERGLEFGHKSIAARSAFRLLISFWPPAKSSSSFLQKCRERMRFLLRIT